jgi:hypothetical protein
MAFDAEYAPGSESVIIEIALRSSTTGQLLTGVAYGSVTVKYQRDGVATAATPAVTDGTLGTWGSGTWKETQIAGLYQYCIPNAALAAGVAGVTFMFSATGAIDAKWRGLTKVQQTIDAGSSAHYQAIGEVVMNAVVS